MASSAAGRGRSAQSKEEVLTEMKETVRVAMLSVQGNDVISVAARENLNAYSQAILAHPNDVIKQSLCRLNAEQLKSLGETAAMNNHKYTVKALAKAIFSADDMAVVAMTAAMGYITTAQINMAELAFVSQYHDQMKSAFRDDVISAYGEAMARAGMAAGMIAQAKATAKAAASS